MKNAIFKSILTLALISMVIVGCKDKYFDSYQTQASDARGNDTQMVSTAVTVTNSTQFYANAVAASSKDSSYSMIPVIVTSAALPLSHDVHITMVADPASLASYNSDTFDDHDSIGNVTTPHPENYYIMPDPTNATTPKFSLVDNGAVTISAKTGTGFLKINTASADYFGSTIYAFSYKIASVQEGNAISGNNNFGIVALVPKNPYDGVYSYTGSVGRWAASGAPNNDGLDGKIADNTVMPVVTSGPTTNTFKALWADGATSIGGVGLPQITVNPDNTIFLTATGAATPANWGPIPGKPNNYDPATKTFTINWRWGGSSANTTTGTTRGMLLTMKYLGPR